MVHVKYLEQVFHCLILEDRIHSLGCCCRNLQSPLVCDLVVEYFSKHALELSLGDHLVQVREVSDVVFDLNARVIITHDHADAS